MLNRKRKPPVLDITGNKYGYLIVQSIYQDLKRCPRGQYFALCNCTNCGNKNFSVRVHSLKQGLTSSCGCSKDRYIKTSGQTSKLYTGYKDISGEYFSKIKAKAKSRNIKFNITIKQVWNIFIKQNKKCALSGQIITFNKRPNGITASIDRIDSKKGYIQNNIQIVHKHLNIMKNIYSNNYFISLCKMVSKCHK